MQVLRAPQAVSGTAAEIGSVVVPLLAQDLSGGFSGPLGQVLDLWSQERFRPRIGGMSPPVLLLMFNRASPEQLAEARALVGARPVLMESFAGVEVLEAGLEGERDLYARGAKDAQGAFGNKAGPNFLFQAGMEAAAAFGGFALQIEVDCLPTGPGWLDAAAQVARGSARAWVVGSIFAGPRIDRSIQTHLNGNALYRAGDPNFQTFLREVWMADLVARAQRMPYLAYDCWWAMIGHEADSWLANEAWHLWQRYESFFRSDPFVVNLLGGRDSLMRYIETYDRFADLDRAPVFFHGPVMKEVLPVLLQNPRDSLFDTLERLATDAEEEPPEPPVAEGRLVLVSGFHPIGRAAPQHGGRPHA
ncbi:hypothetical protein [Rubellimicrobium sp. CFH 75288]|uniref:hypothetical protein n=1 Tax=Rubellimicrobium sp. CFH 75288 TaxID=2697034 RepID=UPI001412C104|nr:hypothetical protein [Rubellimicrobium sp. CFH 75288]NAZ38168.1 hypothetical protein [Rubellimicrobium sp. CFH 75288]